MNRALALVCFAACTPKEGSSPTQPSGSTPTDTGTAPTVDTHTTPPTPTDTGTAPGSTGDTGASTPTDPGPAVDLSDPQLYSFEFTAADADSSATLALGTQLAELDTRVTPIGRLVVYLHGAGTYSYCGVSDHGDVLAAMGYHVLMPCYVADYGVENCGDDIGGCRLEAFEGVDHSDVVDITPPDSIETRVVRALEYLEAADPGGDWSYYLDGDLPRWDHVTISGISHGASTSGLIGKYRDVDRVVMLSGVNDVGQPWLTLPALTPVDRYWGFTHTADDQHDDILTSYETLGLPGVPTSVDGASPPYDGSHRLETSAYSSDGHSSTQAGGTSPDDGAGGWLFLPVWTQMYLE